ncbi:LysE family translocator [Rhodoferax ferrireducens]|uniref:LysE family translocator n=1 Tax=Rhodoferax ferrireducens TaxID=192843 RepID=UPI001E53F090|nr:LysE family translocator [Rhodoferax ferrireducens]
MEILTMVQTSHLWLFGLMVLGVIVLPGLDMAFVVASALTGGRRAGLAAVAGVVAGGVVHVLMATLGIGIVLRLYPVAFNAMLLAGALYIAWIGWSLWRGAAALGEVSQGPRLTIAQTFWRGTLTCLMNPKAYVFMLAIFPQFMRTEYGTLGLQAVMMALIIASTQTGVYGAMAWGAGGLQDWLRNNPRSQIQIGRAVGALLIVAALWTGWQGWRLNA